MSIRLFVLATVAAVGLGAQGVTFEVASIKPAAPISPRDLMMGRQRVGMKIDGAQVNIANSSLMDMVRTAYQVKPYQVEGPEWMKDQRWEIVAKLPEGAKPEQVPEMLQALLAERFKMAAHRETKEHSVYALVVGKDGPKMKPSEPAPAGAGTAAPAGPGGMGISADVKDVLLTSDKLGAVRMTMVPGVGPRLEAQEASMGALAEILSRMADRPVVDMTGLKGTYQVTVNLTLEDMRNMATAAGFPADHMAEGGPMDQRMKAAGGDGASAGSIFQNVQQLGLKLEARKAPMEMVVVDHVEKAPTEN